MIDFKTIKATDPELYEVYREELTRQRQNIELIASENFVSPAVMAAMIQNISGNILMQSNSLKGELSNK